MNSFFMLSAVWDPFHSVSNLNFTAILRGIYSYYNLSWLDERDLQTETSGYNLDIIEEEFEKGNNLYHVIQGNIMYQLKYSLI